MADNTNEENVDKPTIPQSEELSAEVVTNIKTINPTPETDNMEVHHHSHAGHGKKNWKSYAWEFLMLFLAVFCGFLAELQLEHYIEHKREIEYIESLTNDIKSDIINIEKNIKRLEKIVAGKDSMVRLINRGILTGLQADTFYALHKAYIGMNRQTPFSKATISQLFNAGNLRLIRKRNVVDSIGLYAARIDYFEKQLMPQFNSYDEKTIDASEKLVDPKYFLWSTNSGAYLPASNCVLASTDVSLLKAFAFRVEIDKGGNVVAIITLKGIGRRAEKLLALLEKEYNLK